MVGGGGAGWWLRGAGCVFGVRALRGREGKGEVKGFVFFFLGRWRRERTSRYRGVDRCLAIRFGAGCDVGPSGVCSLYVERPKDGLGEDE